MCVQAGVGSLGPYSIPQLTAMADEGSRQHWETIGTICYVTAQTQSTRRIRPDAFNPYLRADNARRQADWREFSAEAIKLLPATLTEAEIAERWAKYCEEHPDG